MIITKNKKHGDNTNLLNAKWWKIFKTHISGILLELKKKKNTKRGNLKYRLWQSKEIAQHWKRNRNMFKELRKIVKFGFSLNWKFLNSLDCKLDSFVWFSIWLTRISLWLQNKETYFLHKKNINQEEKYQ